MTGIQELPLWRDYSTWQDDPDTPQKIDVSVAKDNGVVGVICRASKSWTYKDDVFKDVYKQAGELGLYRTSYHLFSPGATLENQTKIWFEQHPNIEDIPRVIDLEVNWNNLEPVAIASELMHLSDMVLAHDGVRPWIYTRANLVNAWVAPFWTVKQMNDHYWWLAQYDTSKRLEEEGIVVPDKVEIENVIMKQTASEIPGFPGEADSTFVDRNRWLTPDMDSWIAERYDVTVPDTTLELRVAVVEQALDTLEQGQLELAEDLLDLEESYSETADGIIEIVSNDVDSMQDRIARAEARMRDLVTEVEDIVSAQKITNKNIVGILDKINKLQEDDLRLEHKFGLHIKDLKEQINDLRNMLYDLKPKPTWWEKFFQRGT